MQERNRSKVGRMARLRSQVEIAEAVSPRVPSPALSDKVQATVGFMRKSGATEADIEAFVQSQTA